MEGGVVKKGKVEDATPLLQDVPGCGGTFNEARAS